MTAAQPFPRTPLLAGDDPEARRAEIRACFHATCDRYESLFETLADDEAYTVRPITLRHPLIFYHGHTATFFVNKLVLAGLLVIASPYTRLEEHAPREEWLGGYKRHGENFTTLDGLKALLGAHFRLVQGPLDVPFVIRETRRKFQHTLSQVTVWERLA